MDVSEERYDSLLKAEMILNELEVAGVEHWEGYPMVMDEIKKIEALKEKTEFFAESIMELLFTKIKPTDQDSGFYFEDGTKEELLAYFNEFGVVLDQQSAAVEPAV